MSSVFHDPESVDAKTITFTLSPTNVTYANCLRRAVQSEVSILGFRADMTDTGTTSDVTVTKNTTPLSNEMLADRIGLLPIAFPAEGISTWEKERYLFRLSVENKTEESLLVTASMIECLEKVPTSDERVRVPNTQFFYPDPVTGDTCIIAVLKPFVPGQSPEAIELTAWATPGKGKEHARFNPSSQCSYGYTRDPDEGRILKRWQEWLVQKKISMKDLDSDETRKKQLNTEFRSLELNRSFKIDANGEPYSYDFTVESVGTMSPYTMVYTGLLELAALCEKYAAVDVGELPDTMDIRPADGAMKGYDLWFRGEDHTLGSMLQAWIVENTVSSGEVDYAGYKVPHPLRKEMVLRLGVTDSKKFEERAARTCLATAAKGCADMFREWSVEWSVVARENGFPLGGDAKAGPKKPWEAHAEMRSTAKGV
jgi:DNA-directed RNA polymerase subunit L/DNA-directed RNA polymerase alpha subunit